MIFNHYFKNYYTFFFTHTTNDKNNTDCNFLASGVHFGIYISQNIL